MKLTYQAIKAAFQRKGYRFYTKAFDLNIFGIRSTENKLNSFDDWLGVAYVDESGVERLFLCPATTQPGTDFLLNPMNPKGAAIVKPGQYPCLWIPGIHSGYEALVQSGAVTVYRDTDQDEIPEEVVGTEESGIYGIDLHRRKAPDEPNPPVGKSSAGCQVTEFHGDFDTIMGLVGKQIAAGHGNRFTYTLFLEAEV